MKRQTPFLLLAVTVGAALGGAHSAYAADGWFNNAKVNLVSANAAGNLQIRTDPHPRAAGFGCTQPLLNLGFAESAIEDDALARFALGRMHETILEAYSTGASVDMYLDEVSGGDAVSCYVNRLQIYAQPTAPTTNPPTTNPPTTNPPTRDYYGAFYVNLLTGGDDGPWKWGYSTNQSTQNQAGRIAQNRCEAEARAVCVLKALFGNGQCLVIHTGDKGRYMIWNTGPRNSLNALDQEGLAYCRRNSTGCRLAVSECNSGP